MASLIQQILNILITPPGNLVYHIIVTFSVAGALQAALVHWQRSGFPQSRRTVIGLALLLGIRLAAFVGAAAAWQGLLDENLLPPIDRALTLLSLVLMIWLWAFPEPLRMADAATVLLSLLAVTLLALALVWWSSQGQDLAYNGSWLDTTGEIFTMAVILAGVLALLLRHPNGWGYGLAMLLTLLAGHAAHLLASRLGVPEPGDYSGAVRLAEMAALPLLLILPQRFPLPDGEPTLSQPSAVPVERRRYALEPRLLQTFLAVGLETEPGKVCQAITRVVANAMLADLCLLVSPIGKAGQLTLQCGYNLIREEHLGGCSLSRQDVPVTESVLRMMRAIRLPASSTSPDLIHLAQVLNLERAGHFLAVPIVAGEEQALAELILLSPYSNRVWDSTDQDTLEEIAGSLAQLLQRTNSMAQAQANAQQANRDLDAVQAEIMQTRQAREKMLADLIALEERFTKEHLQVESLTAIINAQEETRMAADKTVAGLQHTLAEVQAALDQAERNAADLKAENERLNQAGLAEGGRTLVLSTAAAAIDSKFLQGELRLALEEIARLRTALFEAGGEPLAQDAAGSAPELPVLPLQHEQRQAIASIAQDLRQPVLSVTNYADFLLAESVGALGALQRKFLERIKISTQRMSNLIDELISVTASAAPPAQAGGLLSILDLLNEALTRTAGQRQEKKLTLHAELPERLPPVKAGRAALLNAFTCLLSNAEDATPPYGEVGLRALVQLGAEGGEYILIQVSDQGGGITSEDLQRIFSGLHGDRGSSMAGAGDHWVDLANVRTDIEAQEGRVWVDSRSGVGTVFSILLPAVQALKKQTENKTGVSAP